MTESVVAFVLAGVSVAAAVGVLRRRGVTVTVPEIAATLPWFGVVGVAVAVERSVPVSGLAAGFLRSPTAYLAVGAVVGGLWVALDAVDVAGTARWTAAAGVLATAVVGAGSLLAAGTLQARVLAWNGVAVGLAIGGTALVLRTAVDARRPAHGWLGGGVVFAHVLDATTTGVGLERLGTVERNPISAAIIRAGEGVGPSGVLLFLLVKVAAALLVLRSLDPDADRVGREAAALLVLAAGAGLVPAVHNLVVFALTVR